jgi:hypothetical protein
MLDQIRPGNEVFPPLKILIYGTQGIGKNTFASTFKAPVVIQTEEGSEALDTPTFPLCNNFQEIVDAINDLHGKTKFKTVILDTLDWTESMLWTACCESKGWSCIEDAGYGKGYIELDKWWRHVMQGLDSLRHSRGMDVIVLAHAKVKNIKPPDTDEYASYQIKLQDRAFALWQEWASMVLFLNYKVNIQKTKTGINEERTRGIGTGDRMIFTTERPAYKAKSRWPLPDEILIGKDRQWKAFHEQLTAATGRKYINPYAEVIENKKEKK